MQRNSRLTIWVCSLGLMFLIGCDSKQPDNPPSNAGATSESSTSQSSTSNPAPAKDPYRIVLITNGSSPFWDAADRGSQEAGEKLGVKVEFLRNDATEAGQIERLEQLAGQKDVKGIGISLIDEKATGVIDQMKALREKGVHVITFDADGPKDCREAFVGTNNLEAGRALGQATATLRPDGGSTVCFVGIKGSQNARERLRGFTEGAGEKIKVVDVMEDQVDESKARNNVTAAIQNHPDLNILTGIWSYNAPAIADIVEGANRRKDFAVVVFDAEPNAIGAMGRGLIDVMLVQNPYEMGYQGVTLLHALIEQDEATVKGMLKDGDIYDTGFKVVVPDDKSPVESPARMTLDKFKGWLAEKDLEGS